MPWKPDEERKQRLRAEIVDRIYRGPDGRIVIRAHTLTVTDYVADLIVERLRELRTTPQGGN